jgi:hypothetical protein
MRNSVTTIQATKSFSVILKANVHLSFGIRSLHATAGRYNGGGVGKSIAKGKPQHLFHKEGRGNLGLGETGWRHHTRLPEITGIS